MPAELRFSSLFLPFLFMMVFTVFLAGCTKEGNPPVSDPLMAAGINQIIPANLADSVEVNPVVTVTFEPGTDPSRLAASVITLKKGSSSVPGKTTISGTTAIFKPESDLTAETEYTATISTDQSEGSDESGSHEYSWKFKTGKHRHSGSLSVISTDPPDKATEVPVSSSLTVTFNQELTSQLRNGVSIILMKGQSAVEGILSFSGSTAIFTPAANLESNTLYSGRVRMGSGYHSDDKSGDSYKWSFTAGAGGNDVSAPSVISVLPLNNATSVAAGSTYSVTFSEQMDAATITSASITLKQGSVSVPGTVTYSGVTATFTPSAVLALSTAYTGTVTTDVTDIAGNPLAVSYSSSFTTAAGVDNVAPAIVSTTPGNNATSVAVASAVSVTFSEIMNSASITSTSFTLKQGTTSVAGNVSYNGTVATFTPSAALTGNTVYTGTVTTAATDVTGNALATNHTWSFTTVATPVLLSFASDVVSILKQCNNCHTHGWTTSTVASTFYTNLVNDGYVNKTAPATSKMYTKLSGGHPGSSIAAADITKILTWFTQGANNN